MSAQSPGSSNFRWRFRIIERVGSGAYGHVYKAFDTLNHKIVALKSVKVFNASQSLPTSLFRELKVLQSIKHENIVNYYETIRDNNEIYISMEFCDIDLQKQLYHNPKLNVYQIKSVMKQILQGLEALHSQGIAHRDIKPANILIKDGIHIKIADFGLSKTINSQHLTSKVCSLAYRAPELIIGSQQYSTSIDIWSAGIIFYELVTGEKFPVSSSEIGQLDKIFQIIGSPNVNLNQDQKQIQQIEDYISNNFLSQLPNWKILKQMQQHKRKLDQILFDKVRRNLSGIIPNITSMLSLDPESRPTASKLLENEFFKFDCEKIDRMPIPEAIDNSDSFSPKIPIIRPPPVILV